MGNEITELTPGQMIQGAMEKGLDLEKFARLLDLKVEWDINEARKAYAQDFAQAQAEIEPVAKKCNNPQTHSKYADLAAVIEVAQPIYTKYGFSIIFHEGESTKPENIRINADVLHRLGHKQTYYYDIPLDGKGIQGNAMMTKTHAKASSTSYGRRYLLCMIWNISTKDNDGNAPVVEDKIDENKVSIINGLIKELAVDLSKVLEYMSVEKIEDIKASDFAKCKLMLESRRKTVKK